MLGKLVFKLVLVLIWNTAAAAPRECSQTIPASCMSNTNIRIVGRDDHYDLQLCSNSQCIPAVEEKWIRCNKMCDACKTMANSSYCGTNEGRCERRVSTFLDNYCSSNTPSTSTTRCLTTTDTQIVTTTLPCQTVTTTQPCQIVTRQLTSTTTVPVTVSPTCTDTTADFVKSTQTHTNTTTTYESLEKNGNKFEMSTGSASGAPTAVLGVLFGLSMILLVVVTTGWVWTLWKMKKKTSEKASR